MHFLFVSGVVLANASLDIAFHDISKKKLRKQDDYIEYTKQFFVGLLEADGTITVGLKNVEGLMQTGRVRFVITLKRKKENMVMLDLIATHIAGKVVLEHTKTCEYVTWSAESKPDLIKIFNLLKTYPFLTSRKKAQLIFALDILENKYTYSDFIELRNKKYDNKVQILEILSKENLPVYFPGWLSGFIEGKGNFSWGFKEKNSMTWRKQAKSAFTIGQNELHVLTLIKTYFNADTKIIKDKPKKDSNFTYYRLHLHNAHSRNAIFNHFNCYPFLGYKVVSYNKFYTHNQYKYF